jgi:uncharacterized protein YbaR (Trm112 family)
MTPEEWFYLVCPETRQALRLASEAELRDLNERIEAGRAVNRGGGRVAAALEAALVRSDGRVAYPVRGELPLMVVSEGIDL